MSTDVLFDPELIARYDQNGPRYTSYPTAAQFNDAFGENDYREAARRTNDVPIPAPLSLYVHVPFCTSPCFYCGCTRVITRQPEKAARYLEYLMREISRTAPLFDADRRVEQLHFGGGTPTHLDDAQLGCLLGLLDEKFRLDNGPRREFSIEIDPRTVDPKRMDFLASLGFNRLSMGVQDFDPAVQKAVNRVQSEADILALIERARDVGFNSVSLDLIYGLPLQTPESFARTLDKVIEARPDRLAIYSYAHMPNVFVAQRQIKSEDLPDPAVKLALLGEAVERLTGAGYRYIGMDHFALPDDELSRALDDGSLQRNFQGYSTHAHCDLIGLGMSSISNLGESFSQNYKTLPEYYGALDDGQLPVQRGLWLSQEDVLRAEIIHSIMCRNSVDLDAVAVRHGLNAGQHFAVELKRLEQLASDGLITLDGHRLEVTPRGRLLIRIVAMTFDSYLGNQRETVKRFSRVI
ncbi:MAG: oxygen-independent coproporphyrinogen III oxidase [Gammaproteobacteria bacterium]|jgi:oxygen-independent coproporphyrinogen-3 oxidase